LYNIGRHNHCYSTAIDSKISPTASKAVNSLSSKWLNQKQKKIDNLLKELSFEEVSRRVLNSLNPNEFAKQKDYKKALYNKILEELYNERINLSLNDRLLSKLSLEQLEEIALNNIRIQLNLSKIKNKATTLVKFTNNLYLSLENDLSLEDLRERISHFCYLVFSTFYIAAQHQSLFNKNSKKYLQHITSNKILYKLNQFIIKKIVHAKYLLNYGFSPYEYSKSDNAFKKQKEAYQKAQKKHSSEYVKHRRFVRSINRLNYLKFIDFNFGRCTALTATISDAFIDDKRAIDNARLQLVRYLKSQGVRYYIVAKEYGDKTNRLHYHYVLFGAPYLEQSDVVNSWGIGFVYMQEVKNDLKDEFNLQGIQDNNVADGAVFYLSHYLKKGVNLQFSRSWFKDGILRNDVYYLLQYDKDIKKVKLSQLSINFFNNRAFVTKNEFRSKFAGYDVEATQKFIKVYQSSSDIYAHCNAKANRYKFLADNYSSACDYYAKQYDDRAIHYLYLSDFYIKKYKLFNEKRFEFEEQLSKIFYLSVEPKEYIEPPMISSKYKDLKINTVQVYKQLHNYRC